MVFDPSTISDAKTKVLTNTGNRPASALTDVPALINIPATWSGFADLAPIGKNPSPAITPTNHWSTDSVTGSTLDADIGTVDGTISNMTQTSGGPFDKYLAGGVISSVQRKIVLSSSVSFKGLSFWVKRDVLTNYGRVFTANTDKYFYINPSTSSNTLVAYDGTSEQTSNLAISDTSDFHHIFVAEGASSNSHWFWVDGVKASSALTTNYGGTLDVFGLASTAATQEVCSITNIQVFDFIPTDSQIAELYNIDLPLNKKISVTDSSDTQLPVEIDVWEKGPEPVNRWDFDNIVGSTLEDVVGTDDGTISNMTDTAGGPFDRYLAGGDITSTIRNVDLGASGVSFKAISLWLKRTSLAGNSQVIRCVADAVGFIIRKSTDGNYLYMYDGSTGNNSNLTITETTTWHHVVIVEGTSNNSHWFHLDKVKASSAVTSNLAGVFRYIGKGSTTSGQDTVDITNIQVFDFIPTDDQIAMLYAAGARGNQYTANHAPLNTLIPTVSSSADTVIELKYDETQDDNTTYIGDTGDTAAQAVWPSNRKAHWGMSQDPSGTAPQLLDSTGTYDGTMAGTMLTEDLVAGLVGLGWDFEGTDDSVTTASALGLTAYPIVFFSKFELDNLTAAQPLVSGDDASNYIGLSVWVDTSGAVNVRLGDGTGVTSADHYTWKTANSVIAATTEYILELLVTNFTTVVLYIDGSTETLSFSAGTGASADLSNALYRIGTSAADSTFIDGKIYDMFLGSFALTADEASIQNLSLTDTLWTWSDPVGGSSGSFGSFGSSSYYPPPVILRNLVYLNYDLMPSLRQMIDLVYSSKLAQLVELLYGGLLPVRQRVDLLYNLNTKLRQIVDLRYGDMGLLRQAVDILYDMRESLRQRVDIRYHLIEQQLTQLIDMPYDMRQYDQVRSAVNLVYAILTEEPINESTALLVIQPGSTPTHGYTLATSDGYNLTPFHVDIEKDESTRFMNIEILTYMEDDYEANPVGTTIQVQINSDIYTVKVRKSTDIMNRSNPHYSLICDSPGYLLSFPHAAPVNGELSGMAQTVVNNLVDLEDTTMTVDWQMVDWLIPSDTLEAENQSPLDLIEQIVEAAGGIIQFDVDGNMECRRLWPDNLWDIDDDSITTVVANYNALDDMNEVTFEIDRNDGFNNFFLSDQTTTAEGLEIAEVQDISDYTKRVKVTQVPFNNDTVRLRTSGGSWVDIINEGIQTEVIGDEVDKDGVADEDDTPELVELIDGSGETQLPIYELNSYNFKETSLGVIDSDNWEEDGTITTDTENNSQVELVYTTKYYSFRVYNPRSETVQFWPEII